MIIDLIRWSENQDKIFTLSPQYMTTHNTNHLISTQGIEQQQMRGLIEILLCLINTQTLMPLVLGISITGKPLDLKLKIQRLEEAKGDHTMRITQEIVTYMDHKTKWHQFVKKMRLIIKARVGSNRDKKFHWMEMSSQRWDTSKNQELQFMNAIIITMM